MRQPFCSLSSSTSIIHVLNGFVKGKKERRDLNPTPTWHNEMKQNKTASVEAEKVSKSEIYLILLYCELSNIRSLWCDAQRDEEELFVCVYKTSRRRPSNQSNNVCWYLIENLFVEKLHTSNSIKSLCRKSKNIFHFGSPTSNVHITMYVNLLSCLFESFFAPFQAIRLKFFSHAFFLWDLKNLWTCRF